MEKLVSIIIPAYNAEKTVQKSVESLLEGSYKNIEVIIVNDGSSDNTQKIIEQLAESDGRVVAFSWENSGVSAARNKGLELANGEYIAFADSDDYAEKDYISDLYKTLSDSGSDLAVNSLAEREVKDLYDCTIDLYEIGSEERKNFLKLNENFLIYAPYAKLYKASIIKENNIDFPSYTSYGEDLLFNCAYIKNCNRIAFRICANYHYIDVENSLSNSYREDRFENGLLVNKAIKDMFLKFNMLDDDAERYIQNRIFDDAYNSAFETWSKDFDGGFFKKYKRTKHIFTSSDTFISTAYIDENKYGRKMLNTFKHKSYHLFIIKALIS